jgi:hypothetical protein
MKNWKKIFWWYFGISIVIFLFVVGFSAYQIIDQAYTISYQQDGYKYTENDLENIIEIFNKTDLSKNQIKEVLNSALYYHQKNDTIELNDFDLIFQDDTLIKISRRE